MCTLVPVSKSQLPELLLLSEKIWLPAFAPLFDREKLLSLYRGMYSEQLLTDWMARPGCTLYFICRKELEENSLEPEQKLIGYLATELSGATLKLDKIYVDPTLQSKGIGRRVMDITEEKAINAGAAEITLRVNRRNDRAIAFYQRCGFEITGKEDFPAPDGYVYDDYLMTKKLS
jgi:ribosomal protein S18 acetylase RimI-like enzyme